MARKRPPTRFRGTPASRSTGSRPRRPANAPQGSGRQPSRQSSSKPRGPKATRGKSRAAARPVPAPRAKGGGAKKKAGAKGKPGSKAATRGSASVREWYRLIQAAAKAGETRNAPKSQKGSRRSPQKPGKGKKPPKKGGDLKRSSKPNKRKPDKRTKAYKEKEKWRRYGHLIRLNRLRGRLWKLAPDTFATYADTLDVAQCMLEKNEGRIPRSNKDLLELLAECLVEVGPREPKPPPHQPPEIDIVGTWNFFELDELMISLPVDFPYDITSHLSMIQRFTRAEYNYPDTFKEYVEYVNRKIKQGQLDKYHQIVIEWRYNSELQAWELWVYEIIDSGFEADAAPLGIPRRPRPGAPMVVQTPEEVNELELYKELSRAAYQEREQLIAYVAKLVEQKDKLFDEYKYMMEHGDKSGAAEVGRELEELRKQIRVLRTRITILRKGKGRGGKRKK